MTKIILSQITLLLAIDGVSSFLPRIPHHHGRITKTLPPLHSILEKEKAVSVVSNVSNKNSKPIVAEVPSWKDHLVRVLDVNGDGRIDHKDAGAIAALAFLSWSLMAAPAMAKGGRSSSGSRSSSSRSSRSSSSRSYSSSRSTSSSSSSSRRSSSSRISSSSSRSPSSSYRNYSGSRPSSGSSRSPSSTTRSSRSSATTGSSLPQSTPTRSKPSASASTVKLNSKSSSTSSPSSSSKTSSIVGERVNMSTPKSSSARLRTSSGSSGATKISQDKPSVAAKQSVANGTTKPSPTSSSSPSSSDRVVSSSSKKSAATKSSKTNEIASSKSLPNPVTPVGPSVNSSSKKETQSPSSTTKKSSSLKVKTNTSPSVNTFSTTSTNGDSKRPSKVEKTSQTKAKRTGSSFSQSNTKDVAGSVGRISGTASPLSSSSVKRLPPKKVGAAKKTPTPIAPATVPDSGKKLPTKKDEKNKVIPPTSYATVPATNRDAKVSFRKGPTKKSTAARTSTISSPIESPSGNSGAKKGGSRTSSINGDVKASFQKDLRQKKSPVPTSTISAPINNPSSNAGAKKGGSRMSNSNMDVKVSFRKDLGKKKSPVPTSTISAPINNPSSNSTPKKTWSKRLSIDQTNAIKDKSNTSSDSKDGTFSSSTRKRSGKRVGGRAKSETLRETRPTNNIPTTRTIIRDNYIITGQPYNNYDTRYYQSGDGRYYNGTPQQSPDSMYDYNKNAPAAQQQQQVYPPYRRLNAPQCNPNNPQKREPPSACACDLPLENEAIEVLVDPTNGIYVRGGVTFVDRKNCDFTVTYFSDDGYPMKKAFHVISQQQGVPPY